MSNDANFDNPDSPIRPLRPGEPEPTSAKGPIEYPGYAKGEKKPGELQSPSGSADSTPAEHRPLARIIRFPKVVPDRFSPPKTSGA